MITRTLVLIPIVAILLAACSAGGGSPAASPEASPPAASPEASAQVASPEASAPAAPPEAATRIEVNLTDTLRIEPSPMTVPSGVPVTFVVTNIGAIDHEFFLGDEAAQAEHEAEMAELGSMAHDEPGGISVEPGETKELTFTFGAAGETLAGCHLPGHYAGGMKAAITVTQ